MTTPNSQEKLNKLCHAAIKERLREIKQLCEIDKDHQPNLYQHMLDDILNKRKPHYTGGKNGISG